MGLRKLQTILVLWYEKGKLPLFTATDPACPKRAFNGLERGLSLVSRDWIRANSKRSGFPKQNGTKIRRMLRLTQNAQQASLPFFFMEIEVIHTSRAPDSSSFFRSGGAIPD